MIIQNKKNELEQQKQQLLHNLQKGKSQSTYQVDTKSNIPTIPTVTPRKRKSTISTYIIEKSFTPVRKQRV